jgi:hypothetical protein
MALPHLPSSIGTYPTPLEWENAWQDYLDIKYLKMPISVLTMAGSKVIRFLSLTTPSEASISSFSSDHHSLCKLQRDLFIPVTIRSTEDDFEAKWRVAGPQARQKHYFAAMKILCAVPGFEKERPWVFILSSSMQP